MNEKILFHNIIPFLRCTSIQNILFWYIYHNIFALYTAHKLWHCIIENYCVDTEWFLLKMSHQLLYILSFILDNS